MKRSILTLLPFLVVLAILWWAARYAELHQKAGPRNERPAPALLPSEAAPEDPGLSQENTNMHLRVSDEAAVAIFENENLTKMADITDKIDRGELTAVEGAAQIIRQLNDPTAQAKDPKVLETVLPETFPNWNFIRRKSGHSGFLAMQTTYAEALYKRQDGCTVNIKVMDPGTMQGISGMVQDLTSLAEVKETNDVGSVETVLIDGMSAVVKHSAARKKTTLLLPAHRKYMIMIEARGCSPSEVIELVTFLHLEKLDDTSLETEQQP